MVDILNIATNVVLDTDRGKERQEYVGPGEGINSIVAAQVAIAAADAAEQALTEQAANTTGGSVVGSPVSGNEIKSVGVDGVGAPITTSPLPVPLDSLTTICGRGAHLLKRVVPIYASASTEQPSALINERILQSAFITLQVRLCASCASCAVVETYSCAIDMSIA